MNAKRPSASLGPAGEPNAFCSWFFFSSCGSGGSLKTSESRLYMVCFCNMCLIRRDGRASWRPTYLEDSTWAGAQSPVSDGQQVTVEEGRPTWLDTRLFRLSPGLSRAGPGSLGLLAVHTKALDVGQEHRWGSPALELRLHLFTCCPYGMPMVSVQTCGFVCMLVSLNTLWKHSRVSPIPQGSCACMKTHICPVFQMVALLLTPLDEVMIDTDVSEEQKF